MKQEPTNQDILDVLQSFAGSVDMRFEQIDKRFERIDKRFEQIDKRFTTIESSMVTKDYLDDKLSDLRGDLVTLVRKEDYKLAAIIEELVTRDVFDERTAKRILAMEPYSKK